MRSIRLAVVLAGLVVTCGCLGFSAGGGGGATATPTPTPWEAKTPVQVPAESADSVAIHDGTVVVNRTVTDPQVQYLPGNETVRYVSGERSDGEPVYGTKSFEPWASLECPTAGMTGVMAVVEHRLGDELQGIYYESGSADGDPITVTRVTSAEGDVQTAAVSAARLRAATPGEAVATVTLDGRSSSCRVPVTTGNTSAAVPSG